MLFNLVKKGYGSYNELRAMPTDVVLKMKGFENFLADYETEYNAKLRAKYETR